MLARISEIIDGRMRQGDLVVRYGGEEICVLVPDSRKHNAARVADDIRKQIEDTIFNFGGNDVSVTVSAGVAQSDGRSTALVSDVLKKADKALYDAKAAGRNRVVIYEDENTMLPV